MPIINTKSTAQARKEIEATSKLKKPIIVQGKDADFNRKILEIKKVDYLILSHKQKKDRLKQRDSGLNQILCKIAKENDIIFILDFKEFADEKDLKERAIILSRLIQNIKLLKKYKNPVAFIDIKNYSQLHSFLLTIGSSTDFAKQVIENSKKIQSII